ncbi:hypothetical protein TRFO_31035 [Tritrichomonas foetus]|uniref:Uncharacterized protein n=1 Tax=Tritrichomonas foetus TaxID=1144522 RepID=A0A1J4JXG0_9EUKA|nr:hypothetical protein TRFO_31035 [Tritrichomonas foetus]|eukprot:OHT01965.1 hypothetical protein TRFO_31035 [Tritrichomonas foetus]
MDVSKTPTLSINKKATKVFGRPPDGSSVASEATESAGPKTLTIQFNTSKPRTPAEKKKRQSKIPSHIGSATKPKQSTMYSEPAATNDFSVDSIIDDHEERDKYSIKAKSVIPVSPNISTNNNSKANKKPTPSNIEMKNSNFSVSNHSLQSNISVSSISRASKIPPPPSQSDLYLTSQSPFPSQSPTPNPTPSPSPKKTAPQRYPREQPPQIPELSDRDYDEFSDSPVKGEYSFNESPKSVKNDNNSTISILPQVEEILDDAPTSKMTEVAKTLEDWQQNLLSVVSPLEIQQQQLWYNSLIEIFQQQNLGVNKNQISFYDELVDKSRRLLKSHRFSYPGGISHRFKIAVTGPSNSGKSTLLSVISNQLLLELIASGDWKQTFVFPVDVSLFVPLFDDFGSLYTHIVQLTISLLAAQRPLLVPYTESLIHAFQTVVTGVPLLPKPFLLDEDFRLIIPAVQQLLDIITQCWRDSTAMTSFAVNIFMFPYFLSTIFGFKKFIIIADHFDLSDVTKIPGPPFVDSTENIFISEVFKFALNESSYIVAGKNSSSLLDLLSTLDIPNKGYSQGIENVSTLDLIEPNEDDECSFNIAFENDEPSLTLNAKFMGGCPLYHLRWREINIMSNQIAEIEEEEEEEDVEEDRLALVNLIQALLKQVMASQDGSPYNLSIKNVTRIQAKKQE